MGVVNNSQSQNKAQTKPMVLMSKRSILLQNLFLKVSVALMSNKLIESETDNSDRPNSNSLSFIMTKLNGRK